MQGKVLGSKRIVRQVRKQVKVFLKKLIVAQRFPVSVVSSDAKAVNSTKMDATVVEWAFSVDCGVFEGAGPK